MSDRDRLLHPVTGSLVAVLLMLLVAGLVSHQRTYHSRGGDNAENRPLESQVSSPPLDRSSTDKKTSNSDVPKNQSSEDLIAQQDMAKAAWAAVRISVFGLIGLVFTVAFAGLAWWEARKSAKADNEALKLTRKQLADAESEARVSADRAERQIDAAQEAAASAYRAANAQSRAAAVAQEIGQKQSMAYVHVTAAYTPGQQHDKNALVNALSNHKARLVVDVENIGNTVAKYVTLFVELVNDTDTKNWPKFRELDFPRFYGQFFLHRTGCFSCREQGTRTRRNFGNTSLHWPGRVGVSRASRGSLNPVLRPSICGSRKPSRTAASVMTA